MHRTNSLYVAVKWYCNEWNCEQYSIDKFDNYYVHTKWLPDKYFVMSVLVMMKMYTQ